MSRARAGRASSSAVRQIRRWISGFRNTSFTMHQQLWSAGRLRATFDCVLVLLQPDGSGRYPIPDNLRRHFIDHDGATPEG